MRISYGSSPDLLTSPWSFPQPLVAYTRLTPDAHKDEPNRDQKIESHKQDSVQKAKDGAGEWKPELASSSEQIAAADKHDMSMEEMQKQGAKKAEEGKNPSGSS